MKRACTLLLLSLFGVYLYLGVGLYRQNSLTEKMEGFLSDIAEEVIAIPLETTQKARLGKVQLVKWDGSHLFLASNGQLYHFDSTGKFICQITNQHPVEDIRVTDYVVDSIGKRLVVVGDRMDIHYYAYDGTLLAEKEMQAASQWNHLYKLEFYDQAIWATVDKYIPDPANPSAFYIEKQLCKYDLSFNELESRRLAPANIGRDFSGYFDPEIAVDENGLYAYTPSLEPEFLLKDTLFILQTQGLFKTSDATASVYPVRTNGRFLFSTYTNSGDAAETYTFCFDKAQNIAYQASGGFQDNIYRTGKIASLQPIDVFSNTLCYLKSGKELKKSFPQWKEGDNPVVFLVQLKA